MSECKHTILCIDDDPDILVSLRIVLESGGYRVESASDAPAALQAFKSIRPDVVILDLMMEEIDTGTQLLQDIRRLDPHVPVYMLSSTGDYLHGAVDVKELGLAGIFQKPIDPNILLTLLRAKLKGHQPV